MTKFADWVKRISNAKRPVFVAFNLAFDWSFVNYYFFFDTCLILCS
jgi:ribonuclease T